MTREEFMSYVKSKGWVPIGLSYLGGNGLNWAYSVYIIRDFCKKSKYDVRSLVVNSLRMGDVNKKYDELKLEFDKILEYEKRNDNLDKFANVWFESKETGVREDIADLLGDLDDSRFCDCDEEAEVDDLVEVNMTDAYGRDWYEESDKIYENVKWHVLRDLEWIMQNKREYCIPYIACRSTLTAKEIDDILLEEEPLALDAVVQIAHAMGHRVEINFVKEDGGDDGNE